MHVTVCICTCRRPEPLRRLLAAIERQVIDGTFAFSLVVADNDAARSGSPAVEAFRLRSPIPIVYCVEPRRNIALARNRALEHAAGDFIAWIDDDEFPAADWLQTLVSAAVRNDADGVLGPVRPHFDAEPPTWLVAGRFCNRREHPDGATLHWRQCFMGNSLLRGDLVRAHPRPFRVEFGLGGEDADFFRRMIARGHRFVWCGGAVVFEVVPPTRWTRAYRLKRALLLGRSSLRLGGAAALATSMAAAPIYLVVWPLTFVFGQHVFMKFGIKLASHAGRILAWLRINPITSRPD